MRHKSFFYKEIIVNYQDEGVGDRVLVLLHGFMNNLEVWQPYTFDYRKEIRIVTIDLLGHGDTGIISEEHTMEMQADVVKATLDYLNIPSCVIAGHSMGGYVALAFAKKYPQCCKGLVMINSHAMADNEKGRENRDRMCQIVKENRASFVVNFIPNLFYEGNKDKCSTQIRELEDAALDMDPKGIIAAQQGMRQREGYLDVLTDNTFPFLFIIGKKDPRMQLENVFAQAMLPYHSEVMLLENVGHMSHIEARPILKDRLLSFTNMCYLPL
jgi:Predicted hydrolases or acyltransferases (alpha/beta hydrolase superfamily)